ncbi:MAG: hypothetical protein HY855_07875 [Burkholderiales bacterium]|nr:hypothetical protein [Burkholderiales bacterium]
MKTGHALRIVIVVVLVLTAAAVAAWRVAAQGRRDAAQQAAATRHLSERQALGAHELLSCAEVAATRPLVLLALGQSNAGNHGQAPGADPVTLVHAGRCVRVRDPLPGATGQGGSVWSRLPAALRAQGLERPVVLAVLGVDASPIAAWADEGAPIAAALNETLQGLRHAGLAPTAVLWHQGEADGRLGTPAHIYDAALRRLAATIRLAGVTAPILVARTTICRSAASDAVRSAIRSAATEVPQLRLGPDLDTLLVDTDRFDGCHLSTAGLDRAAQAWATTIASELSSAPAPRQP